MDAGANRLKNRAMARLIHPAITGIAIRWLADNAPTAIPDDIDPATLDRMEGVPVSTQRLVLEAVAGAGGSRAVVGLAEALRHLEGMPLLYVLLNSSSVRDLVDKEQRLNRYLHSNHRVRIHELTAHTLELEHHARWGRQPVAVESHFVLGVHLVLLDEIGCRNLTVTLPESAEPTRRIAGRGRVTGTPPEGGHRRWRFRWTGFEPTRRVLPGLDEVLLAADGPTDLAAERSAAVEIELVVRSDLAHRWTLAEAARLCRRSPRSLQRALAAEKTSFTEVLDRTRVAEAARRLAETDRSMTEIGFACGFSDAAHFSRRFKNAMGEAPSAWRRAISTGHPTP